MLRSHEIPQRAVCVAVTIGLTLHFGVVGGLLIIASILGLIWVWESVDVRG